MLQHLLGVEVRDQKRDVITLQCISLRYQLVSILSLTGTGFLRRMKNASALCVKNLVNLCTKMCSISSACLIRMLTRTLLTDGSTSTRSSWLRDTVSGLRTTSGDVFASISGTLCRSDACEAKFERESAAVSVDRTQERYGRRDCDYKWSVTCRETGCSYGPWWVDSAQGYVRFANLFAIRI